MNPPKCNEYDYINFWAATQKVFSCVEAERVQPDQENAPSHDSITRLLHRLKPETSDLWNEAKLFVNLKEGVLVSDDSTLSNAPWSEHPKLKKTISDYPYEPF